MEPNSYAAKVDALSASLDAAASKELRGTVLEQNDDRLQGLLRRTFVIAEKRYRKRCNSNDPNDSNFSRLRGKESIFKKPEMPISRCLKPRKMPDYQVNPHKWKKYSLEDVDISDHTNTSAAFSFLKQMDDQKEDAEADDETPANEKKIEFKKSSKIVRKLREIESDDVADVAIDKPKLKGTRLVMPEYVIGQLKKDKKKKANTNVVRAAGTLTLSHLQEEEAEDDEG